MKATRKENCIMLFGFMLMVFALLGREAVRWLSFLFHAVQPSHPFYDVKQALKEGVEDSQAETKRRLLPYTFEARLNARQEVLVKITGANAQHIERPLSEIQGWLATQSGLPDEHPAKCPSLVVEMYEGAVKCGIKFISQAIQDQRAIEEGSV